MILGQNKSHRTKNKALIDDKNFTDKPIKTYPTSVYLALKN